MTTRSMRAMALTVTSLGVAAGCSGASGRSAAHADSSNGAISAAVAQPTTAASDSTSGASVTSRGNPPASVTAVGEHGEDLYDAVTSGNWRAAAAIMDSLDRSANELPSDSRIERERTQVGRVLDSLRPAVTRHERVVARELANRVTYLSSMMTAPFSPATPTEVLLLDYYGRELEVWSAERSAARLTQTSQAIRKTWNAVRPSVESHGGSKAATDMERDVKAIEAASSPAAFGKAAKPFLDEVDELEKVFTNQ